jgi:hypothetical protein
MKLRFPDYLTTAQDGGKVVSLTHRPPLPPGNTEHYYKTLLQDIIAEHYYRTVLLNIITENYY